VTDQEICDRFLEIIRKHGLTVQDVVEPWAYDDGYGQEFILSDEGRLEIIDTIGGKRCESDGPTAYSVAAALILRAIQDRLDGAGVMVCQECRQADRYLVWVRGTLLNPRKPFPCRPSAMLAAFDTILAETT